MSNPDEIEMDEGWINDAEGVTAPTTRTTTGCMIWRSTCGARCGVRSVSRSTRRSTDER